MRVPVLAEPLRWGLVAVFAVVLLAPSLAPADPVSGLDLTATGVLSVGR